MNNEKARKFKERILLAKKMSIEEATKKEKISIEKSQDTKIRREINDIIKKDMFNGKSKLEILLKLSSNPEYQKYRQYFKKWINAQYEKINNYEPKGKIKNEPERD